MIIAVGTFLACLVTLGFVGHLLREVDDIKKALYAEIERCRSSEMQQRIEAKMPMVENYL